MQTMFASTLELLKKFTGAGGKVLALAPLPTMIEGEASREPAAFFKNENVVVIDRTADLSAALEALLERKVGIKNIHNAEAPEFMYMLRDMGDCRALFVVNNDRNGSHTVQIQLAGKGQVEEWNPLTGETNEIAVEARAAGMSFEASFGPAGSKLYIVRKNATPKLKDRSAPERHRDYHEPRTLHGALGPVCAFTRTEPNALTLDTCRYRMNGGAWSEELEVWRAQKEIRTSLGMRQVYYNSLPQRYKWVHTPHPGDGALVGFRFNFNVVDIPEKDVFLVLEQSKDYRLELNGDPADMQPCGWFIDRAFDRIRLPKPRQGSNELMLSCDYRNRMEVEDCYLIGDLAWTRIGISSRSRRPCISATGACRAISTTAAA
jgi:hypothetical protein